MNNSSKFKVLRDRKTIAKDLHGSELIKQIKADGKKLRAATEYIVIETPRLIARERGARKIKHIATYSKGKVSWRHEVSKTESIIKRKKLEQ